MKDFPLLATSPGIALTDENLSDAEFRLLSLITTLSGSSGCKSTNAALAGLIGASVGTIRTRLESLLQSGWLMEEKEDKHRVLRVRFDKMEMVEVKPHDFKKDVFDESNAEIREKDINHVIAQFIKYRINPNVNQSPDLMNRFYANSFNRNAARKLIEKHGTVNVDFFLEKYGKRVEETFCPKSKSLVDVWKKWDSITKYLGKKEDSGVTVVE